MKVMTIKREKVKEKLTRRIFNNELLGLRQLTAKKWEGKKERNIDRDRQIERERKKEKKREIERKRDKERMREKERESQKERKKKRAIKNTEN